MRTMAALVVAAFALALPTGQTPRLASSPPVQVADMGMGSFGPQLGDSQNDMVLSDPGHIPSEAGMITSDPGHVPGESGMVLSDPGTLPAEPNMVVTDPGFVPREAQMDVGTPQDDDQQDDILQ